MAAWYLQILMIHVGCVIASGTLVPSQGKGQAVEVRAGRIYRMHHFMQPAVVAVFAS